MKSLVISTFLMLLACSVGANETPDCTDNVQSQYSLSQGFSLDDLRLAMDRAFVQYPKKLISAIYVEKNNNSPMVLARWMQKINKYQLEYLNGFSGPRFVDNLIEFDSNNQIRIFEQNYSYQQTPNGYVLNDGTIKNIYSIQRRCTNENSVAVCRCGLE